MEIIMDIAEELAEILADIEDGNPRDLTQNELYMLLTKAAGRIDRLQRENRDLLTTVQRLSLWSI